MSLVDVDLIIKELEEQMEVAFNKNVAPTSWSYALSCFIDDLKEQPTVDAEPVRHGKWERVEYSFVGGYRCSCCGSKALDDSFNYCGYCGAKMDGE